MSLLVQDGPNSLTTARFGRTLAERCPSPGGRGIMNGENRTKAALRLFLVSGLGLRSANTLVRHFKELQAVFDATRTELEALGIPPDVADDVLGRKSAERAEEEWAKTVELGVDVVDILSSAYPPLLREIYDPPIVLYIRGMKWNSELDRKITRLNSFHMSISYAVFCL